MKRLLFILVLIPLFISCADAADIYAETARITDANAVEEALDSDTRQISGKLEIDGSYDYKSALKRLWSDIVIKAADRLKYELKYGLELTVIALLCSCAASFAQSSKIMPYINIVSCAAASIIIAGSFEGIINQASDALLMLSDYSKAVLPAIFASAAACGAVGSSAAKYAAVSIAIDIIMSAAQKFIIPMIYAYLAICIVRSIFDNPLLSAAARMSKWCATTLMTMMTLAFSSYISITGLISGSTDVLAVKTARTIISNSLPVVGGIISDASAVVLSAASVIKNSIGVFALISVCAMCAGPFIELSVKMLVFRAAAAACDMLPGGKLPGLINDVGNSFSMLLGLVGCCGIMLFISIMAAIKVVTV